MARKIATRLRLTGRLEALTPLHVGGWGTSPDTDLPLAHNGAGQPYVPGTSLTGVLRQAGRRTALWGDSDAVGASRVLVEDAQVTLPQGATIEIRDGVGIDRATGAAAKHIKYDRAVLPRGSSLNLKVTVECGPSSDSEARSLLADLLVALEGERVRLGAGGTRGLGRVKLVGAEVGQQTLDSPKGILRAALGEWEPWLPDQVGALRYQAESALVTIKVTWHPNGPLLVKADYDGVAADTLPLLSGVEDKLAPVLPGSSIKGVIRSQAERIVRTVRGLPVPEGQDGKRRFLNQVALPLVDWLCGAAGKPAPKGEAAPANGGPLPGRGALSVDDCYATQRVDRAQWRAVENATGEKALREALDAAGIAEWQEAFHVAVDRWTGGAAESLLYTVLEPFETTWEELTLTLDPERLPDDVREPALALLLLVLRDLQSGLLPFGHGGNRGLGAFTVDSVTITGSLGETDLSGSVDQVLERLKSSWRSWITTPEPKEVAHG